MFGFLSLYVRLLLLRSAVHFLPLWARFRSLRRFWPPHTLRLSVSIDLATWLGPCTLPSCSFRFPRPIFRLFVSTSAHWDRLLLWGCFPRCAEWFFWSSCIYIYVCCVLTSLDIFALGPWFSLYIWLWSGVFIPYLDAREPCGGSPLLVSGVPLACLLGACFFSRWSVSFSCQHCRFRYIVHSRFPVQVHLFLLLPSGWPLWHVISSRVYML